ncbi:MAG TPA: 2Fe-2S iron-sulfur cluster-binding protein [Nocardioidaceae bacterium]|jgi:ferredoxin
MPTIQFRTSGRTVAFDDGDDVNLLRTSIRYDCGVPYKCASGNCGTDRVLVEAGADNLSRIRPKERDRLGDDVDRGYRLACQTYVSGDVTISWEVAPVTENQRLRDRWLAGLAGPEREGGGPA